MRRVNLFLLITVISLASLIGVVVAGYLVLSSSTYPSNWMGEMWNNMGGIMGNHESPVQTQNAAASYFGWAFVALVGIAIAGIVGLVYFIAFPEIKTGHALPRPEITASLQVNDKEAVLAYDSVLRTLNEKERRVVEVLKAHDGKYLQKYIRSEAGLSRLQTHRIVARLAERGVVTLEKTGNTNEVYLADWLK